MTEQEVQKIRDFNRFYTNVIGLVDNHILNSPYSLPEARVLYELYHHQPCTASRIMESINMDKGYLSRLLKSFEKKGILTRRASKEDKRATHLSLTAKGNKQFESINKASATQIKNLLSRVSNAEAKELIKLFDRVKKILST